MEFKEFYEMQRNLDDTVEGNYYSRSAESGNYESINHYKRNGFLTESILALQVEVAELANETKCFKYWSTRQNQYDREKVLKEYVDSFHFFLGIGNLLGFSPEEVEQAYKEKNEENHNRQLIGY